MIVKMRKVFVVTRAQAREPMLEVLRELGVIHLEPVDPKAAAPEDVRAALERVRRARQAIAMVAPAGGAPELAPADAVNEILQITRRVEENRNRLNALSREASRLKLWGELRSEQLEALAEAGVPVKFCSVPLRQFDEVRAECVARLGELPGKRMLVGLVQREGEPALPETAQPLEPPERDLPAVRAEAKAVDEALAADAGRLAQLADLGEALEREEAKLASEAQLGAALAGAMRGEDLFAVQGWAPAADAGTLSNDLRRVGIRAGVESREPSEEEQPPTLIRYPRWARPIKGLFDILGTFPGYREAELSGFFMVALPIFAAILIGDAGYGLLFLLLPLLFYRKAAAKAGPAKVQLIVVVGAATLAWGLMSGNVFGVSPAMMIDAGGGFGWLGTVLDRLVVLRGEGSELLNTLLKMCFFIGAIHLSLAHLRRAIALAPDVRALAQVGWVVFVWGMLGVIMHLFFGMQASPPKPLTPIVYWALGIGGALAVCFSSPGRNPAKALSLGLASSLMPALGTFSDTLSYIRLMAVGLASTYIAKAFNGIGATVFGASPWLTPLAALVILFGHLLNVGLCLIAIFAHGVRLNMLEFSSNVGVEWAGYPYEPFSKPLILRE